MLLATCQTCEPTNSQPKLSASADNRSFGGEVVSPETLEDEEKRNKFE